MKRVVITGSGVLTPLGNHLETLTDRLLASESAIQKMPDWAKYKGLHSLLGAPVVIEDEKVFPRKVRRSMGRLSMLGALAAKSAFENASIEVDGLRSTARLGCIMGSTMGGAEAMNEAFETMLPDHDLSELSSMSFFKCVSHTAAMNVAQALDIKGYLMATSAACASSLQAIGLGYELIRSGRQDVMLCGGAEELHPIVTGTFDILFATSTQYNDEPEKTPRPFDAARDGLVCGEGAGVIVLEEYEHAKRRGAKILGEVVGYATSGSGDHVSQSNREGMRACIESALSDAGYLPSDIDFVSAHATATLQGDKAEAEAIGDVFGKKVPVNSLKGNFGHTLGASGAIELATSLEMMKRGQISPTRNLSNIDADCVGILHVQETLEKEVNVFVKNCFAFGGINATLVCKRFEP